MIREFRMQGRHFKPGFVPTVATVGFVALTVALGNWQMRRAAEKLELARALDAAALAPVLSVPAVLVDASNFDHRRVRVHGRFVARDTFFLDNKVSRGVAGYHVVTPFRIAEGDAYVLVDRGWVVAGNREKLPLIKTPEDQQTLEGIARIPSTKFIELAPEAESGRLVQNLDLSRERARLGLKLQPFLIEQTTDSPDGLVRQWQRTAPDAERHRGYALQWYLFAAIAVILYAVLGFRRPGDPQ